MVMSMVSKEKVFEKLLNYIQEIASSSNSLEEKLRNICKLLKENIPYYDWVGFYLVNKSKKDELILGPFVGEPTEHVKIPFGKGVCGRAAEARKTIIVQDVSKESNYLACSPKVRSEIVVPITKDGEVLGEIDIDSHTLAPFTKKDKEFLEKIAEIVADLL